MGRALTIVAEGGHPDTPKPLKGFGAGVFELALRFRIDAYRVVYAAQIGEDVWVLHAFQKAAIYFPNTDGVLGENALTDRKVAC